MTTETSRRLLLVDDEADILRLLENFFSMQNYQVDTAADGLEALKKIKQHPPDLVITDMKMPNLTGIVLITRVRKFNEDLPIVMLTAFSNVELAIDALRAGATNFILKPVQMGELKTIVNGIFKNLEARAGILEVNRYLQEFRRSFELPGDAVVLSRVSQMYAADLRTLGMAPVTVNNFVLVLQEALYNAYYHGNLELSSEQRGEGISGQMEFQQEVLKRSAEPRFSGRRIRLEYGFRDRKLWIEVADEGAGFDWRKIMDQLALGGALDASGRGLLLISSFAEKLEFNESGNRIRIILDPTGGGIQPASPK